jgi:putative ABC transport system permease protein
VSEPRARAGALRDLPAAWNDRHRHVARENIREALRVVRGHRMRSGLLVLGVAIAVTTILAIVAILEGLAHQLEEDFASAARPYLGVQKYDEIFVGDDDEEMASRPDITFEDAEVIRRGSRTADKIDFYIDPNHPSVIRYKDQRTPFAGVAGSSEDFTQIFALNVEQGRFFTRAEIAGRDPVIVLGHGPASYLFHHEDPIGKRVRVNDKEFTVIGTFAERRTAFGNLGENYAVVPHTTLRRDLSDESDQSYVFVAPRRGVSLEDCREELIAVLRQHRRIGPGEENDFGIITSEAYSQIASRITGAVFLALVIISSIGLLVGGIGVMNIMLISVAERTREIGVRMAVGATRGDVLLQILVESGTLTGAGGVLGIGLGLAAAWGITRVAHFPFEVPILWIAIAVVFSVGIGVLFGLYPANRAARLDPIEALRYE